MPDIIKSYTLCEVNIHIDKAFAIRLRKPSESAIERVKESFGFQKATLDAEGDFVAEEGELPSDPDVKIKQVLFYRSQSRLAAGVLGGDTATCHQVIHTLLEALYGLSPTDLQRGTDYVDYNTVTRAKFSKGLDCMFSAEMREILEEWRRLESRKVVGILPENPAEQPHGMIAISSGHFDRMYKGQEKVVVVPSDIAFHVFVPTKFYKMTQYSVRLQTQSVEDYMDNLYYVKTELPFNDHMALLDAIETMKG